MEGQKRKGSWEKMREGEVMRQRDRKVDDRGKDKKRDGKGEGESSGKVEGGENGRKMKIKSR